MPGRIVRGNRGAGQDEWTLACVDRSTHVVPKLGHLLPLVDESRLLPGKDERRINLGSSTRPPDRRQAGLCSSHDGSRFPSFPHPSHRRAPLRRKHPAPRPTRRLPPWMSTPTRAAFEQGSLAPTYASATMSLTYSQQLQHGIRNATIGTPPPSSERGSLLSPVRLKVLTLQP